LLSAHFFFQSRLVPAPSLLSCSWCRAALPSARSLGLLQSMGVTPEGQRDSPWLLVKTTLMGPVGIHMRSKSCSVPVLVQPSESAASVRRNWLIGAPGEQAPTFCSYTESAGPGWLQIKCTFQALYEMCIEPTSGCCQILSVAATSLLF